MHLASTAVLQLFQSCYVSLCQIYHMDVITHTLEKINNHDHYRYRLFIWEQINQT